jgi:hypothetical protein
MNDDDDTACVFFFYNFLGGFGGLDLLFWLLSISALDCP